jgi:hypothetical protein
MNKVYALPGDACMSACGSACAGIRNVQTQSDVSEIRHMHAMIAVGDACMCKCFHESNVSSDGIAIAVIP